MSAHGSIMQDPIRRTRDGVVLETDKNCGIMNE